MEGKVLLEFLFGLRHGNVERGAEMEPRLVVGYTLGVDIVDVGFSMRAVVSNDRFPLVDPDFELNREANDVATTVKSHSGSDLDVEIKPYDPCTRWQSRLHSAQAEII